MARLFRVWEKKRGQRSTGSQWIGSVSEAMFFGAIFLLGVVSFALMLTSWALESRWPIFDRSPVAFWLLIIVLGSFVAIGGSGVSLTIFRAGTSLERRSAIAKRATAIELISDALPSSKDFPTVPRDTNLTNSPGVRLKFRLPMAHSPAWRLAAVTTFCVVWNVIATVLLVITARGHLTGEPQLFVTIFSIPFLAIGLWAIYHFLTQLWIHTGIGPTTVEISTHPLVPRGEFQVYVSQSGHLTMNTLRVRLVCEEQASFTQGTDTRTETRIVHDETLLERGHFSVEPSSPFAEECNASIPADAMHSFQSNNNRIQWRIVIDGDADRWPSYRRRFPLVVYPQMPTTRDE